MNGSLSALGDWVTILADSFYLVKEDFANTQLIQTLQEELRPSLINVTVDSEVPFYTHKVIIIGGYYGL